MDKKRIKKRLCVNCKHRKGLEHFVKMSKFCRWCDILTREWRGIDKDEVKRLRERNIGKYWPELTTTQAINKYEELLKSQNGACAICSVAFTETPKPHIDHCHTTNHVRGLLCGACNRGLGQFKDIPEALERAAQYLRGVVGKIKP
jgi:hypothetical protein